jgi:DNA-binding transcriptional ArsR family regulator
MDDSEQRVFAALADPTRRFVIEKLSAGGTMTATELAEELPISRQGISKHLKVLEDANLVITRQKGRERLYSLSPRPLAEAAGWVAAVNERWADRLQALRAYLEADAAEGAAEGKPEGGQAAPHKVPEKQARKKFEQEFDWLSRK